MPSKAKGKAGRSNKRVKTSHAGASSGISRKLTNVDLTVSDREKLDATGFPIEYPVNKDSYRYVLAEKDNHAPLRGLYESNPDRFNNMPLPGFIHRRHCMDAVRLSLPDRAPQLKISENGMCVSGHKGYCTVRATHGVRHGQWYYEARILDLGDSGTGACRIGWSMSGGHLQAPVGYDHYSYSWRSKHGTKFHNSVGKHYSDQDYSVGDVVGVMIELPYKNIVAESSQNKLLLTDSYKDEPLVRYRHHLYYEIEDKFRGSSSAALAAGALRPLDGSKIQFFKNGVRMGVAFDAVYDGYYYPALSLYKDIKIRCEFGPKFEFPPDSNVHGKYQPMSERASEESVEIALADVIYNVANDGKPTSGSYYDTWMTSEFGDLLK